MKKSFATRKAVEAAKKSKKSTQKHLRATLQICDCKKCFGKVRKLAKSTVGNHRRMYGRHPDARNPPLVSPSQQRVRTPSAPQETSKSPHMEILTDLAVLERDDIFVTIANAEIDDDEHELLLSTDFDGSTEDRQVS
ncbi:hypothetical protein FRC09_010674, partial [Ceratobasidium sp. 395]